jgi:site-specific recombinase XerC
MAHLLDTGSAPGTVRIRHMAVRRFAAWLIATSRLRADPFVGVKGPVHRQAVVMPLSDDELRALIGTCTNPPAGSTSRSTTGEMRQSSG